MFSRECIDAGCEVGESCEGVERQRNAWCRFPHCFVDDSPVLAMLRSPIYVEEWSWLPLIYLCPFVCDVPWSGGQRTLSHTRGAAARVLKFYCTNRVKVRPSILELLSPTEIAVPFALWRCGAQPNVSHSPIRLGTAHSTTGSTFKNLIMECFLVWHRCWILPCLCLSFRLMYQVCEIDGCFPLPPSWGTARLYRRKANRMRTP